MELRVEEYQLPEKISFNFEELKQELAEKVKTYEAMAYTEDQIKIAKADRANLSKLKKALNDERIRREKEYMIPFNGFKAQVNEIISIIDKPIAAIDTQVKGYEEKQKEDKLKKIQDFFDSCGDVPEWLQLAAIFDQRWLNATASMKSVQEAITSRVTQINIDLATLAGLPEFGYEAQQVYQSTLDINKALAEGQRMAQIQKQKAEYEAEQARLKAEEEAKKAAFPADTMNPPAEEACDIPQEAFEDCRQNQKVEEKQWISFAALLSTEDALALKEFFGSRNIEFKAI